MWRGRNCPTVSPLNFFLKWSGRDGFSYTINLAKSSSGPGCQRHRLSSFEGFCPPNRPNRLPSTGFRESLHKKHSTLMWLYKKNYSVITKPGQKTFLHGFANAEIKQSMLFERKKDKGGSRKKAGIFFSRAVFFLLFSFFLIAYRGAPAHFLQKGTHIHTLLPPP